MSQVTNYYKVANHVFCVNGADALFALMGNYEPFLCHPDQALFTLSMLDAEAPVRYREEIRQEDEGQEIICGKTDDGLPVFEFRSETRIAGWLVCDANYQEGRLFVTDHHNKFAIDNALMVLFALSTADRHTALFHAAAVSYRGRGYMFLGQSGTGKSTHARLWVQYMKSSVLVNDDNPVVQIDHDGNVSVYGSPWSGKTPCYRKVSYPLGGIVLLHQAPYNEIRRMESIEAYVSLMTSISGMRWEARMANGLHDMQNALVQKVPVWYLDCLPDEAAAVLCNQTITL